MNKKLIILVAAQLEVKPSILTDDSGPKTISEWDSVRMLTIIAEVEEVFQISIEPSEIESIDSIGKLSKLIEKKLN